jgi:hypothetical protein
MITFSTQLDSHSFQQIRHIHIGFDTILSKLSNQGAIFDIPSMVATENCADGLTLRLVEHYWAMGRVAAAGKNLAIRLRSFRSDCRSSGVCFRWEREDVGSVMLFALGKGGELLIRIGLGIRCREHLPSLHTLTRYLSFSVRYPIFQGL